MTRTLRSLAVLLYTRELFETGLMHMQPVYEYVNDASEVLLSTIVLFETGPMHMHPLCEYVNDASAVLFSIREL